MGLGGKVLTIDWEQNFWTYKDITEMSHESDAHNS